MVVEPLQVRDCVDPDDDIEHRKGYYGYHEEAGEYEDVPRELRVLDLSLAHPHEREDERQDVYPQRDVGGDGDGDVHLRELYNGVVLLAHVSRSLSVCIYECSFLSNWSPFNM